MPRDYSIDSVLVIGSGPIVIGQACEFDYSGTQSCRVLRKEGIRTILINSNPATIMTDPGFADATYIEPITSETIEKIIIKEKPKALLATLGGQTALNAALALHNKGILEIHGVKLIGADVAAIERGENRELFKAIVEKVGGESARSVICHSINDCLTAVAKLNYPVVIRPSFTMGGLGSGIAYDEEQLRLIAGAGLANSPITEVLLEESIIGWKEYELEVMRDQNDNTVIICGIENFDPMGVHTGDSITVAPILTLTDVEYQKLRDLAINIIKEVGVATGGCNIQFAINPENGRIIVIEMNPRVSRSSALASKATGFPIAKIATLLAIGYSLDEIQNDITKSTPASFEPTLDYVVVKIPRFAFEKFPEADTTLTTTMKSVGEAMALGRSFPESLMKAIRSIEKKGFEFDFSNKREEENLALYIDQIKRPTEYRIIQVQRALYLGASLEEVYDATKIDRWFLAQIIQINEIAANLKTYSDLTPEYLWEMKTNGFSDSQIASILNSKEEFTHEIPHTPGEIAMLRERHQIHPVYKMVDTCAAEFESHTPYFYSTYDLENEVEKRVNPAVIILGSGPNRIGQGIEFDYSCVHASFALREAGITTVMINCNPETVSTDYDTSDRLYFEPLTIEDVLEVIRAEEQAGPVLGVITQLGGQTPLGLARGLAAAGVKILGTSPDAIDLAEERGLFGKLLKENNLEAPEFGMADTYEKAQEIAKEILYPVLVRPSYVLGGRGMEIVYDDDSLKTFIEKATQITPDHPVMIDKFLEGAVEIDVDALYDGEQLFLGGIMEHIEEAGIHSGDSACVIPTQSISISMLSEIKSATLKLASAIGVKGLINIQFAIAENGFKTEKLYVIEANPRASRTVPFVSKATGTNLAKAAALICAGKSISQLQSDGVLPPSDQGVPRGISVKEAVLPFNRFRRLDGMGVDCVLGPEMKSTGEVMGIATSFGIAYAKSQTSAFSNLPISGSIFITVSNRDKALALEPARLMAKLGFRIYATAGTHEYFTKNQIDSILVKKESENNSGFQAPTPLEIINQNQVNLIINTPLGRGTRHDGWLIRTAATTKNIPLITTISGFKAAANGIRELQDNKYGVRSLQEWQIA